MKKDNQIYVVFEQFHFHTPDHIEYEFRGREYALANYSFLKMAHPDKSLGMCTIEEFRKKKEGMKQMHQEQLLNKLDKEQKI